MKTSSIIRSVAATLAGVVVAVTLVMLVEGIGHRIWPPPSGMDPTNPESIREAMAEMPLGALLSVAVAWIVGSFGGAMIASGISRRPWPGWIVGGLIALAGVSNLLMIPHPIWFWPVALILVPLAAHLAWKAGRRPVAPLA